MTDQAVPGIPQVLDSDVFITRAFKAPREVVWRFFTEPEHLARWFGPAATHVDAATISVDVRAGGNWDLDMVDDASGEHYPMRATLTAVIPPEYLEGTATAGPQAGTVTLRIWLHDHGDTTRLTLHQGPFEPEFRDMTTAGWTESFDKIDAILEESA